MPRLSFADFSNGGLQRHDGKAGDQLEVPNFDVPCSDWQMPLHENAAALIRANLEQLVAGQRPKRVEVGELEDARFAVKLGPEGTFPNLTHTQTAAPRGSSRSRRG